jgi:hypothetical protein
MPAQIKVISASDFIRAKPTGEFDLEASEHLLAGIAKVGAALDDFDILIDTREAQGVMSATDLWFLADKLVHYRSTFARKTAVLCPLEKFDRARFFAMCAENRGFNMRAFADYEQAMEWLMADAG